MMNDETKVVDEKPPCSNSSELAATSKAPKCRSWRAILIALHRDIGFLCVGLTLLYAISGIAMNHRHQWNPNQSEQEMQLQVGSAGQLLTGQIAQERVKQLDADVTQMTQQEEKMLISEIMKRTQRTEAPTNTMWQGPKLIRLFFGARGNDIVEYEPQSGQVRHVLRKNRVALRDMNFLHRNSLDKSWTWIGDIYAILLAFLAISGAIVIRGKRGLKGWGSVYLLVGLLVPIIFIWIMR